MTTPRRSRLVGGGIALVCAASLTLAWAPLASAGGDPYPDGNAEHAGNVSQPAHRGAGERPAHPDGAQPEHPGGGQPGHPGGGRPEYPGGEEPEHPGEEPEPPGSGTCFDRAVTIPGTENPDVLIGTLGSDVIGSLGGNDVVRGDADVAGVPGGDTDYICLGDGDDIADGAANADFIDGGTGNDTLDGDNFPSPFGDTLIGGEGNDTFTGGMGDDTIEGGPGNDIVDPPGAGVGAPPSAGADRINTGEGDDLITEQLDGGIDTIDAGPGNDRCVVDVPDVVTNCETVIRVF